MTRARADGTSGPHRFLLPPLLILAAVFSVALAASAGATGDRPSAPSKLAVFVTVDPQAYFVERIGGDRVDVSVLVGPGQCAETFEPTTRQIARLGGARVYFSLGMPMEEALIPRIRSNFPRVEVIDARAGIPLRSLDGDGLPGVESAEPEPSDEAEDHHHEGADPHVWLNPRLAKTMARSICEGLIRVDAGNEPAYRANLAALEGDLDRLDAEIAGILKPVRGKAMLVYHPYYGYFADAYGLRQRAIEVGGFRPGSKYLAGIIDWARKEPARTIFVQVGGASVSADAVAKEIGGRLVTLDPMSRDYLENLRDMARKVRDALSTG